MSGFREYAAAVVGGVLLVATTVCTAQAAFLIGVMLGAR